MEDDPTTSADDIIAALLASTSAEAMAAGALLQNQSFGFVVGQLTGPLGEALANIFGDAGTGDRDPLEAVLDVVTGVNQATALVNSVAQPQNTNPDMLTAGDLSNQKTLMEAFFQTNPDLSFIASFLGDAIFLENANPVTLALFRALSEGATSPFLDALEISTAFFNGFDPSSLAFAAIAANAPAALQAEAPDDNSEDPVSPDDPAGSDGDDILEGGSGGDKFDGGGGNDSLAGGGGKDTLKGGAGKDTIEGGGGKDDMEGGGGGDLMKGGGGKDTMSGGGGKDTMEGGGGKDEMSGGGGKDDLDGGGGRDMLSGGGGKDTLKGGRGKDTLDGGGGKDTFVFSAGDKGDTITDFNFRKDKIIVNDSDRAGLVIDSLDFALRVIFGEDPDDNDLRVTIPEAGNPRKKTQFTLEDVSPEDFNTDAFEFQRQDGELDDGDQIL